MFQSGRELWMRHSGVMLAGLGAVVFGGVLLILFVVVGGGGSAPLEANALQEGGQSVQQQAAPNRSATVVKVNTQARPSAQAPEQQVQSSTPALEEQANSAAAESSASRSQQSAEQQSSDSVSEDGPQMVAGHIVQPLSRVMADDYNEDALRHGSDGSEGGILPIDNGVVPSSGPKYATDWELIVPSARLKSSIVKVGSTPSGAMGSPDNPYVVGWLDSSAAPGEPGNALLAGHRDFEDVSGNVGTGVCWELVNTQTGDQMIIRDTANDIYYVYSVIEAVTVNPRDRSAARYLQNTDRSIITLITCEGSFNIETHQYSHRRVVVGALAAVASPDA